MPSILASEQQPALRACVGPGGLLAFDYDGTLAPIVADPARAGMRDSTRRLLAALAQRCACAVITGRSRLDALRLLQGVPLIEVVGNHGAEVQGVPARRQLDRVARWHGQLQAPVTAQAGAWIEDKRHSLTLHYRRSPRPLVTRAVLLRATQALEGVRVVGGKRVLNLVPVEAKDKGGALLDLCRRRDARYALYVGDDDTDEDVFAIAEGAGVVGVRVGLRRGTRAHYFLRRQAEIDALLTRLLALSESSA